MRIRIGQTWRRKSDGAVATVAYVGIFVWLRLPGESEEEPYSRAALAEYWELDRDVCDLCHESVAENDEYLIRGPHRGVLLICGDCHADGPARPGEEEKVRY